MDEKKIAETRKDAQEILHELAVRHPGAASWIRTIRGYLMESLDALAEAQATVERQDRLRLEEMTKRDRAEGMLASCTDLLNSWAREWGGVAEAPDEFGIRALAERLWDRMAPEILNLREDKRIAFADVDRMYAELSRLRADTRRLDWLITESNEARIDWLSDSFWDALEDGDDVLAAARATIDAEINRERVLGVIEG
jgi:hypothetical protein